MDISSQLTFELNDPNLPIIKKRSEGWLSTAAVTPNAIEGDPTLFMRTFGQTISEYFGFKFICADSLQVPNVTYFNSQIEKLNLVLGKQNTISLSFYETHDGIETTENYLRKFVSNVALPIAKSGTVGIHDATFHYGGIFFPQVCLMSGLIQSDLILRFIDSLAEDDAKLKSYLFDETVLNIDSALGNFSYSYLSRSQKVNPFWILSRDGLNAIEYLEWFVIEICKMHDLTVPLENLESFKSKFNVGQYKVNLSIKLAEFYSLTEARVTEILKSIYQIR